jgi:hypothetical protein
MARRVAQQTDSTVTAAAAALDPVRRQWYDRYVREGDSADEALRKARAFVPARERMRAV